MIKNQSSLVIGGDGKLGASLYKTLKSAGCNVLFTSRKQHNNDALFLDLTQLDNFHIPDKINIVYWCAAEANIARCEAFPRETALVNIEAVEEIIRICNSKGIKLVFPSTSLIFSKTCKALSTSVKCKPVCEYGKQKLFTENLIKKNCHLYTIIRFGKILTNADLFLKKWKDDLNQGKSITAFFDLFLSPLTMSQAVDFIIKYSHEEQNGIYQLSASTQISYYHAGLLLAQELNLPKAKVIARSCRNIVSHQQKNVVLHSINTANNLGANSILMEFFSIL